MTFDDSSNSFVIPDIPAGNNLTFEFTINPDPGSGCPVTDSAKLLFLPYYTNQCGDIFGTTYYTPVIGPQTWTMAVSNPPTMTVVKTGPTTADVGQTGLSYDITVTYSGPDQAAPFTTDIIDHYPAEFILTNADGGTVDTANRTITWSDANFQNSGDTITHTIVMDVPADPCLGFQQICNRAEVTSVPDDCQGCPGVINLDAAEACTQILDTHGNVMDHSSLAQLTPPNRLMSAAISSSRSATLSTAPELRVPGTESHWTIPSRRVPAVSLLSQLTRSKSTGMTTPVIFQARLSRLI